MDRQKLRVVVIDDSRTYREVLEVLLQADGDIEVVGEASDGDEGIEVVLARKPDLVTMDIEMPGLDGLSAIKRIMAELPVPILVVTGARRIALLCSFKRWRSAHSTWWLAFHRGA